MSNEIKAVIREDGTEYRVKSSKDLSKAITNYSGVRLICVLCESFVSRTVEGICDHQREVHGKDGDYYGAIPVIGIDRARDTSNPLMREVMFSFVGDGKEPFDGSDDVVPESEVEKVKRRDMESLRAWNRKVKGDDKTSS